jgi:glycosyltransferase involved in cell wall biosynthesis
MYEAARDFVKADILFGHEAYFVDTGASTDGITPEFVSNPSDKRNGFTLPITTYENVLDAELIVAHTGIPDNWIVRSQAPIIFIMHGRPLDCFRPEQNHEPKKAYTLLANLAKWPRIKKMVTMWEEHYSFWEPIVPNDKLVLLDPPPMDGDRFSSNGTRHFISQECKGELNLLIADSWRSDVDIYEIMNGIILASKKIKGLKIHNYAVETQKGSTNVVEPWNLIFDYTKRLGIQGEVFGRVTDMEQIYRAMDVTITPHRIATRIIGESLCCGTPVIAGGSRFTKWNCHPEDPKSVAEAIEKFAEDYTRKPKEIKEYVKETSQKFNLSDWGKRIDKIYQETKGAK